MGQSLLKSAAKVTYGDFFHGTGSFDDESDMPVVIDPDTGEGWISPVLTGVNTTDQLGPNSPSQHHRDMARDFAKYISEWDSNSIARDPEALKKYIARYAKAMEDYRSKTGKYPKQRVIGHSRGGGGAIELMRAINKAHPEFPQFDEFIGLDPYDYPGAETAPPRRLDKKLLARRSIVVRPQNRSFFAEGVDSPLSFLHGGFANLLVRPAIPVNPLSKVHSLSVAIPDAHHSSIDKLMEAAMEARKARNRAQLRKVMKNWNRLAEIESAKSPDYDDKDRKQIYEKAAHILKTAGFLPAPLATGLLTGGAIAGLQAAGYSGAKNNLDSLLDVVDANDKEREAVFARHKRDYIRNAIMMSLVMGGVAGTGKALMK